MSTERFTSPPSKLDSPLFEAVQRHDAAIQDFKGLLIDTVKALQQYPIKELAVASAIVDLAQRFSLVAELIERLEGGTAEERNHALGQFWADDIRELRNVMWVLLGNRDAEGWNQNLQPADLAAVIDHVRDPELDLIDELERQYQMQLFEDVEVLSEELWLK